MITKIDDMLLSSLKTLARETALAAEPPVAHKIFDGKQSNLGTERVSQMRLDTRILDPDKIEDGSPPMIGERYEWTFAHREVMFAVALQPDNLVPANAKPRPFRFGEYADAYRLSDSAVAIRDLVGAFVAEREQDAADVFNHAGGYDPRVGGDGKALCSTEHPWEGFNGQRGTWANRFVIPMELNVVALDAACQLIRNGYVDSQGLKIRVAPKRLIVAKGMEDVAHTALDGLPDDNPIERTPVVLERLLNELPWFVQTSVPGFVRFERSPLEFDVEHDQNADVVLVKGYERRCYGCYDPRAVFGGLFECRT